MINHQAYKKNPWMHVYVCVRNLMTSGPTTNIHSFFLPFVYLSDERIKNARKRVWERERSNSFVWLLFIYNDRDNSKSRLFFESRPKLMFKLKIQFFVIIICSLRTSWVLRYRWIFFMLVLDIIYLISFSTCFLCQYHNLDRLYD